MSAATAPALTRYRGSRCLVTGGAGFIGSNLARRLLDEGAEVVVLDDLSTGRASHLPTASGLTLIAGDLRTHAALPELVAGSDFIFHLAAQVGNVKSIERPLDDAGVNILGSVRLLDACRGTGIERLVYSSSSAIFGEATRLPVDEDHPQRPASFYALSKLTAERYALLAHALWDVPAVCLRYFNVFGLPMEDNEYTGVISIFFRRLAAGLPLTIYGDGSARRDFVHVEDVVTANLLAGIAAPPGAVYNIGSGCGATVRELAETMCAVTGRWPGIEQAPARAGEVRDSQADIGRARRELGFQPQWTLRDGLERMWTALRDAGPDTP